MKKLDLTALTVESFTTTSELARVRGTVNGHELARSLSGCPVSWNGTCPITCANCTEAACA
jgi:hypothetical protein